MVLQDNKLKYLETFSTLAMRFSCYIRDLKQTMTATATRTWKNMRSYWQNNSSARAF